MTVEDVEKISLGRGTFLSIANLPDLRPIECPIESLPADCGIESARIVASASGWHIKIHNYGVDNQSAQAFPSPEDALDRFKSTLKEQAGLR
jgi:hypothetical protein